MCTESTCCMCKGEGRGALNYVCLVRSKSALYIRYSKQSRGRSPVCIGLGVSSRTISSLLLFPTCENKLLIYIVQVRETTWGDSCLETKGKMVFVCVAVSKLNFPFCCSEFVIPRFYLPFTITWNGIHLFRIVSLLSPRLLETLSSFMCLCLAKHLAPTIIEETINVRCPGVPGAQRRALSCWHSAPGCAQAVALRVSSAGLGLVSKCLPESCL